MKILNLTCLLLLSMWVSADPTPFRAVYQADYKGLPVSAIGIRELRHVEGNKYLFTSSAKSFFTSITEQSLFYWQDGIIPVEYKYNRKGVGKNREDRLIFNWQKNTASFDDTDYNIVPGTLDKLLYQVQMREDLMAARKNIWPKMHYQIADRIRLREYEFEITGKEIIETPIGKFNTVKATRIRRESNRITTFWMSPEYDFLLIRLKQIEDNGGFELLLKEADFNGQPVTGI